MPSMMRKVISAGARFYKGNDSGGRSHSCSGLPNILTLEKTPDSCSRHSGSFLGSPLTHFTEKVRRAKLPIKPETALYFFPCRELFGGEQSC